MRRGELADNLGLGGIPFGADSRIMVEGPVQILEAVEADLPKQFLNVLSGKTLSSGRTR